MHWNKLYAHDDIPSLMDIEEFIGGGAALLQEMLSYLEQTYKVQPKMTYSKCAAQPGWNVKIQKGGKSLCTIYPMEGFFIVLVVVGAKEESEVEASVKTFTSYVAGLYKKTNFSCGGRWLMVEVKDRAVLNDIKRIISIRVKLPKKAAVIDNSRENSKNI